MAIDINLFAKYLRKNAAAASQAKCARYVRLALEAAGANTAGHQATAIAYGPLLVRNGFRIVEPPNRTLLPRKGDVAIIQPTRNGNPAGHIQGFDGTNWISDFIQRDFWPGPAYRSEKPKYEIYRP